MKRYGIPEIIEFCSQITSREFMDEVKELGIAISMDVADAVTTQK